MDDPEQRASAEERADPPDFGALVPLDEVVRGDRTRDDFYEAVLALDSPATASEVAGRAGHGVDAAREYLDWFERMGIATRVTESPATYERNQAYLNWRRVQRLREEYPRERLVELLQTESDRIETFRSEFDARSPDAVSITAVAESTDRTVEDVWERVSAWRTARRRVALLERALASGADDAADQPSPA
ncbi:DUF7342 family protein [Halococcoides cellulosivorans]|uniref:Sugar-specific transcriptional regulator TrmB n=1 Tax=Halococcoides cellulosivorans TaxID=1679096 RepID=A0A2R4WXS4_9EURY|nr:hypothetical protein [Halococcoides cellulosivorans]AWB26343.1 hypothetical protein HARCEL1_00700 [Halococcoides cellulosivorans]